MKLFKKKTHHEHDTSSEVEVYQKGTEDAAEKMKKANENLAKTLERNHITVKIYSGIAGKPKRKVV